MKWLRKIMLFCIANAGRSQMAEASTKHNEKGIPIASRAGNKSADKVKFFLVEAMNEKGIEISMSKSKLPTFQMVQNAAYENTSPPHN